MPLYKIYTVNEGTGVLTPVPLANRQAPYNAAPYTVNSSIDAIDHRDAVAKSVAVAGAYVVLPTDMARFRMAVTGSPGPGGYDRSLVTYPPLGIEP